MTLWGLMCHQLLIFRLTSSHRGWHTVEEKTPMLCWFRLTSSHRGWHRPRNPMPVYRSISTHILSQRMTIKNSYSVMYSIFRLTSSHRGWLNSVPYIFYAFPISTHILSQRMTRCTHILLFLHFHFDSHPLTEDDVLLIVVCNISKAISTHILSQRMTIFQAEHFSF